MAALSALPGLGPASAAMLVAAEVKSVADLRKLGAARAFLGVQAAGLRPSVDLLWALEGALTATPWRKVAKSGRTRLLFEVEDLKAISAGKSHWGFWRVNQASASRLAHARATGSPQIAIDAKRPSNHCGMPRGFLPWGLSNTCPQAGAMRASAACDEQVSDNPKQLPSVMAGSFVAAC